MCHQTLQVPNRLLGTTCCTIKVPQYVSTIIMPRIHWTRKLDPCPENMGLFLCLGLCNCINFDYLEITLPYHEICVAFYAELGFSNEAAGCLELLTQAFITCCMDTSIQMELST